MITRYIVSDVAIMVSNFCFKLASSFLAKVLKKTDLKQKTLS